MPPLPSASEKSEVAPAQAPKAIEVIALRAGFFQRSRKAEGDKFSVSNFDQLGSWMKCVDPVLQKKHVANLKSLKDKRAGASKDPA